MIFTLGTKAGHNLCGGIWILGSLHPWFNRCEGGVVERAPSPDNGHLVPHIICIEALSEIYKSMTVFSSFLLVMILSAPSSRAQLLYPGSHVFCPSARLQCFSVEHLPQCCSVIASFHLRYLSPFPSALQPRCSHEVAFPWLSFPVRRRSVRSQSISMIEQMQHYDLVPDSHFKSTP